MALHALLEVRPPEVAKCIRLVFETPVMPMEDEAPEIYKRAAAPVAA